MDACKPLFPPPAFGPASRFDEVMMQGVVTGEEIEAGANGRLAVFFFSFPAIRLFMAAEDDLLKVKVKKAPVGMLAGSQLTRFS